MTIALPSFVFGTLFALLLAQPVSGGCIADPAPAFATFAPVMAAAPKPCALPPGLQADWHPHPDGGSWRGVAALPIVPAVVAVFDGGFDLAHPALRRTLAVPFDASRRQEGVDRGDLRHGTHVLGIVAGAARGTDENLHAFRAMGTVMPVKVDLDSAGLLDSFERGVAEMIRRKQAGVNIRVVSASFGMRESDPRRVSRWWAAVEALRQADILLVAATDNGMGSDMDAVPDFPSSVDLPNVVVVTSVREPFGPLSDFASHGDPAVDIAADGDAIDSTLPGGEFGVLSGTSMATPRVAAVAGRIATTYPSATADELRAFIDYTGTNGNLVGLVTGSRDLGSDSPSALEGPACDRVSVLLYLQDAMLPHSEGGRAISRAEAVRVANALRVATPETRWDLGGFIPEMHFARSERRPLWLPGAWEEVAAALR